MHTLGSTELEDLYYVWTHNAKSAHGKKKVNANKLIFTLSTLNLYFSGPFYFTLDYCY